MARTEAAPTQQKQSCYFKRNADEPLPRWRFVKKQNPGDGHDRRATGQNRRHRRKRPALLKQEKERDRACSDADSSENGIENSLRTHLLIPTARQPKKRKVKQDRKCGCRFDNKSTETFADVIGRHSCKDLMRAIKNSGDNCIPEPRRHKVRI